MKTRSINSSLFILLFAFIGSYIVYKGYAENPLTDSFKDYNGDEWQLPKASTISKIVTEFSRLIPRGDLSFNSKNSSVNFDLDDNYYNQTNLLFILMFTAIGLFFTLIFIIVLTCKFCCNRCGGKSLPREGYSQYQIDSSRGCLLVFAFILEFLLIYSFFINLNVHESVNKLTERMNEYSNTTLGKFDAIINDFQNKELSESGTAKELKQVNITKDLKYSKYAFEQRNEKHTSDMKKIEIIRMLVIFVALGALTITCTFGIAAGSVYRAWPVWVMVIMSIVLFPFIWASFGFHFSIGKSMDEFCIASTSYISLKRMNVYIPQKLQYFFQCINSPLFKFVHEEYYIPALEKVEKFINESDKCNKSFENPPSVENINNSEYDVSDCTEAKKVRDDLISNDNYSVTLQVSEITDCKSAKIEYDRNKFLLCTYSVYNLNMLTLSQAVASIFLIIICSTGIGSILKFKWAQTSGMMKFDGNNGFAGRSATPKRKE